MILSIFDFFAYIFFWTGISEFMHIYVFQKMYSLPQFFYGMVGIALLSMVGDCGGCWEGVGWALGRRWGGGGRWRVVRVGAGSLI